MHASPEAFDDIRPYEDSEVREVIERLAHDQELLNALVRFRFPTWHDSLLAPLLRWGVRRVLQRRLGDISDVHTFQLYIADFMQRMISTTTHGFEVKGLAQLPEDPPCLFVSNHRDIAMDPAFINYALYEAGRSTVRIAIGDNLLKKPYATDLMRLNKSFIVRRSAKGIREMMAAFSLLSRYIHHTLKQDRQPIWIAQREGRAKDGIDRTDPAIIKMFQMADKKTDTSFTETVNSLNIVPVAISYEYDPCDLQKARELTMKASEGDYAKTEFEDIESIARGISGYKGRVSVRFGRQLSDKFENAEAVAKAIDDQIRELYHLFPSNWLAYKYLGGDMTQAPLITTEEEAEFNDRLGACPKALQPQWLAMYANPVKNWLNELSAK